MSYSILIEIVSAIVCQKKNIIIEKLWLCRYIFGVRYILHCNLITFYVKNLWKPNQIHIFIA